MSDRLRTTPIFEKLQPLVLAVVMAFCLIAPAWGQGSGPALDGGWQGESSGNRVTIATRPGGFAVSFAGTQQAGQADGAFVFRETGPGAYRYTFPNGTYASVQMLGPDRMRITGADGWTDIFRRVDRPASAASPAVVPAVTESRNSAAEAADLEAVCRDQFAAEVAGFIDVFPHRRGEAVQETRRITARYTTYTRDHVTMLRDRATRGLQRNPGNQSDSYGLCMSARRLAQMDGAALTGASPAPSTQEAVAPSGGQARPPEAESQAHNPANEATQCLRPIFRNEFEAQRVSSNMGAVFRNSCAFPVEVIWCASNAECARGYPNFGTFPAGGDRAISYTMPAPGTQGEDVRFAACRNGFVRRQHELNRDHRHACQ